ncbi:MAG: hypothetical protein ABW095_07545 [Candidatus Thiodiazotropha sp.]
MSLRYLLLKTVISRVANRSAQGMACDATECADRRGVVLWLPDF